MVVKATTKTKVVGVSVLRVFAFSPLWGLPSAGPFALKLLAWLNLAGIPYEQINEDNPRKGPKGKNPWIELDGERIGDSELIIEHLSRRYGVDLDAGLSDEQKAVGLAWRRMFEEHFHQVLEWELLVHPAGASFMQQSLGSKMSPVLGPVLFKALQSHMRKQLYARGIGRHPPEVIAVKGRADIDALAHFLLDRGFLVAERPCTADASVFGLLAPMLYWPMQTPVASHIKSLSAIVAYCDRMRQRCFNVPVS
jgi:glutathione S-transferase